jgi:hypothetical protein
MGHVENGVDDGCADYIVFNTTPAMITLGAVYFFCGIRSCYVQVRHHYASP